MKKIEKFFLKMKYKVYIRRKKFEIREKEIFTER